jgi:hypothetical protein
MRIAQIGPLIENGPPRLYGGTERIVSWELVAQGHDVTLFASGQSITSARLVPCCAQALRQNPAMRDPIPCQSLDAWQGAQYGIAVRYSSFSCRPGGGIVVTVTLLPACNGATGE